MARGAFWTIIVDDQPTAFRAPVREDLLPTLTQLHRQHPSAVIKWFQRGRLWETPGDAMDAAKPPSRGAGWRPGGAHKDPREQYKVPRDVKRARWASQAAEGRGPWMKGDKPFNAERPPRRSEDPTAGRTPGAPKPRGEGGPTAEGRPAWKPKGDRPAGDRPAWRPKGDRPTGDRPAWKPKSDRPTGDRPAWKPKGDGPFAARGEKPAWKPTGDRPTGDRPAGKPKGDRPTGHRPGWTPKGDADRPAKTGYRGAGTAGGDRPRSGAPRGDWRGDRPGRETAPRPGGPAAAPAKEARTWRAGQLPPANRKRKKGDD